MVFGNPVSVNQGSGGNRVVSGTNTSGTNTFSGTVTPNDSNATLRAATGCTVAFNTIYAAALQTVAIGGGGNNGTVQLDGISDNINLAATVNSGTLLLNKTSSSTVHSVGGTLAINSGATAQLGGTGGDQIFNSGSITVNSGGVFDTNDRSETVTNISLAGTGISSAGALVNNGSSSSALTANGTTTLATDSSIGVTNSGGTINLSGNITGSFDLAKVGAGSLILTGSNSHTTTTISSGTLQIGNGGSTGTLGSGNVTNNDYLVFNRSGNFFLSNVISGSGIVAQSGTSIITISTANSYTGETNINSGVLRVTANEAIGTGAAGTTVGSGGALRLVGASYTTAEALSINGTGGGNGALNHFGAAPSTYAGQVTVASNASIHATGSSLTLTLTLTGGVIKNGTTLTIGGTITGSVIINGTGISGAAANSDLIVDTTTLVVNATSNYNGPTTIQNIGTLEANAAIDTTTLTVDATSTLAGSGSITAITGNVFLNGNFIVGNALGGSPREDFGITAASTIAGNNSILKFDLFNRGGDLTATPAAADLLNVTGSLSLLSNVVLDIASSLTGWTYGDKWRLWNVSGSTTGTIATINTGITLGSGLVFDFDSNSGVLSVVPEPSRAFFLMLGLLGITARRRRK